MFFLNLYVYLTNLQATFLYDEEDVLRSEVSPEVLASLLG